MSRKIGQFIKLLRMQTGMTQEELGMALGVKKSAVQKYESGAVTLTADKIKKICDTFHVLPWKFIYESETEYWNTFSFLATASNHIVRFSGALPSTRSDSRAELNAILYLSTNLNDEGVARVVSYAMDLLEIDKYRKPEPD